MKHTKEQLKQIIKDKKASKKEVDTKKLVKLLVVKGVLTQEEVDEL